MNKTKINYEIKKFIYIKLYIYIYIYIFFFFFKKKKIFKKNVKYLIKYYYVIYI